MQSHITLTIIGPEHPAHKKSVNPAVVYLASLGPGSRRAMRQALGVIAELLTGTKVEPLEVPWWNVEYQHSQAEMAKRLDIALSSLKNYLVGRNAPTLDVIDSICEELSVSPDWLILGRGDMFYQENPVRGVTLDDKHELLHAMSGMSHKDIFLIRKTVERVQEVRSLDQGDTTLAELHRRRVGIDVIVESLKRVEGLELSAFALGALGTITDFMAAYTKAAHEPEPVLPKDTVEAVGSALGSGKEVFERLEEVLRQIEEEWQNLAEYQ